MDSMDHYLEIGMVMGFGAKQRKFNETFIEGGPRTRVEVFDPIAELRGLWDDLKSKNKICTQK